LNKLLNKVREYIENAKELTEKYGPVLGREKSSLERFISSLEFQVQHYEKYYASRIPYTFQLYFKSLIDKLCLILHGFLNLKFNIIPLPKPEETPEFLAIPITNRDRIKTLRVLHRNVLYTSQDPKDAESSSKCASTVIFAVSIPHTLIAYESEIVCYWNVIAHELGHILYFSYHYLSKPDVEKDFIKLEKFVDVPTELQNLRTYLRNYLEELFADLIGTILTSPIYLITLALYGGDKSLSEHHPSTIDRISIILKILREYSSNKEVNDLLDRIEKLCKSICHYKESDETLVSTLLDRLKELLRISGVQNLVGASLTTMRNFLDNRIIDTINNLLSGTLREEPLITTVERFVNCYGSENCSLLIEVYAPLTATLHFLKSRRYGIQLIEGNQELVKKMTCIADMYRRCYVIDHYTKT